MAESQRKAAFVPSEGGASIAWFGETLRYLVVGEQSEGRFALAERTLRPGDGMNAIVLHRTHVGWFIARGELTFSVGNRTLILPAGTFLGVAPGTAQKFVNSGQEPATLYMIIGPAGLDELHFRAGLPLPNPDAGSPPVTDDDRETLAALAPGYGVDLAPTESALQADPRLRLTLPDEGNLLAVGGELYRYLAVSDDTGGRYSLFLVTVPPGNGPPWHMQLREDELILVLRGSVSLETEGASQSIEAGGAVHLPGGVRHRFENTTPDAAELLILTAPGGLEKLFDSVGRPWHDPTTLPGQPEPREIERLIEESPRHGVEIFH